MSLLLKSTVAASLALGAATAAAKPADRAASEEALLGALQAISSHAQTPPGQNKRPDDPDQGDDNASPTAILTVCTKDTPAAERSAICDREPVSPH